MPAGELQDSEGAYFAAQQRDVYSHAKEFCAGIFWVADYVRLGGGLWYDNNSTGGVTFNCLKDVSSSSARLFDVVCDTEATMQRALRYDFAALLQQGSGVQLPHYGGVDSYLEHCCLSGFPSVQIMLSRLGCTEQPGSPILSRPTPVVVQAMRDEYLGSHPYYK